MSSVDVEQLARLWAKAQPKVAAYISSLETDFHASEDILQNVAAVVVRKREEYDPQRPFTPWAIQIAKFEILKHRRSFARDRLRFDPSLIEQITVAFEDVAGASGLDRRQEALAECVQRVQGRGREALRLRYAKEIMPTEIAERLQMTVTAVNVLLHRTRQSLHKCIEHYLQREES